MRKIKKREKGVALLLSIFAVATLLSLIMLGTDEHIRDLALERHYENNLQVLYALEAAKTACLWEEAAAGYGWDTRNTAVCRLQGASIANGFYRLAGYNFRAQTRYENGVISIYAHAFRGTEAQPQYSRYLEYIYSPSPMYQYLMFSNRTLSFGGNSLYNVRGGKIHSNGNLVFSPSSNGVRFNQISELSSSGTIMYAQSNTYPAPNIIDNLDGRVDGMAPAPYLNTPNLTNPHYYPTDGDAALPGPYQYWYTDGSGRTLLNYKWYGTWVGGDWGSTGRVPFIWRGEESYFYGNQYGIPDYTYLSPEGAVVSSGYSNKARIERFYLSGDSLANSESTEYYRGNVAFRPYQDKSGDPNDTWFELPGALPQDYNWTSKYYNRQPAETPVNFYATEGCPSASAGCQVDTGGPSTSGWRYLKYDTVGNLCATDACYNDSGSVYVKADNYITNQTNKLYYNNLSPLDYDKNEDFFSSYRYGNDINNPENWQARAFNSQRQEEGFQQYLNMLSQEGIEGVVRSGVDKKEPYFGQIFDEAQGDSPYKVNAINNGLYVANIDSVVSQLNMGCAQPVAQKVQFFNWKTNMTVTLMDINVGNMGDCGKAPSNGIIYSKVPIRLSNAANLPGANTEKTAVFTLISEESVYLKGDYNTGGSSSADWKISNIATKKKVYTLSNVFNDPQQAPDFAIYNEYPYVYVKVTRDGTGKVTEYLREEGSPTSGDGVWLQGGEYGVPSNVTTWIRSTVSTKQTAYANSGINPPNRVDKSEYSYNSLFVMPDVYDFTRGDNSLENWYYIDGRGNSIQAKKNMLGAFINFYDPANAEYNNEYYSALGSEEGTWNYRRTPGYLSYPPNGWVIQDFGRGLPANTPSITSGFDARFPQVIPQNFEGVLGFTGRNIWRLTSQGYFNTQTTAP